MPNRQSACSLWATSPTGSTFNSRNIITKKVFSSLKFLFVNSPPGGLLVDDMGLSKTLKAISLIGTSKKWLITNPQHSTPTALNHQLEFRNIQAFSGWRTASQHPSWPHLSIIIGGRHLTM
ncbi:hypothetical protein O181_020384 [Austropuccinia psidii MF-1]|uniref:SNF2 N-terminal domain-containing protein n=1 Tax=Austropuccinia psidii MF-1 TaxID=1389203 RepID=A0A9Q3GVM7_9BASI|nr:hypothetical protein [Austropuccinia psidii MF-1]